MITSTKEIELRLEARTNLDDVTFTWTSPQGGTFYTDPDLMLSDSDDESIIFWDAPDLSSLYQSEVNDIDDTYTITVTATHGTGLSMQTVTATETITVINRVPDIISFVATGFTLGDDPPIVNGGVRIPFSATAVDDDAGDSITYEWRVNAGSGTVSTIAEGSTYQWTLPQEHGLYDVTVVARDGDYTTDDDDNVILASDSHTAQIRVNESATITLTGPTMEVDPGTTHTLTVTLNDPDDTIDTNNIRFITHQGSYVGDLVEVSEGNYTQQWQSPNQKGMALVEVEYEEFYNTTSLGTVSATTRIQVANSGPEFKIVPSTATITTAQELDLEVAPLEEDDPIDPDNDVVTFEWEIESGVGSLSAETGDSVRYIPPSPPDTPAAPTVTTDLTDGTQLGVSWVAPDDNGADITDYDVRYKLSTQDDSHYLGSAFTGTGTTHTIDGLTSNRSYDVQVRAQNFAGESDWSPVGTGVTANDPPTIDSFVADPTTIKINEISTLTVMASDLEDDDLYFEFSIVDDPDDGSFGTLASVEDSHVYTASDEAGDYVIQVQVFDNAVADRDPDVMYPTETVTITVTNVPDKPNAPTVVTGPNNTTQDIPRSTLIITWTAPDNNGSDIVRYEVGYRKITDSIYTDWPLADDFTDLTTTITGLEPDTTYRVRLRAFNSVSINNGASPLSDDGEGETADDVPNKPDAPTLTVPDGETTQIRADWTAPADNGSAITDYDIQYRVLVDAGETENTYEDWEASTVSTDLFTTITGLTETTTYEIRIRAVNGIGNSEWSDPGVEPTSVINAPPTIVSITPEHPILSVRQVVYPVQTVITVVATDDLTDPEDLIYTFTIAANTFTFPGNLSAVTESGANQPHKRLFSSLGGFDVGIRTIQVEVSDGDDDLTQPTATTTVTVADKPRRPSAPTVATDPNDSFQLLVSWTQPNTNFSPITDYDIQYKKTTEPTSSYQDWNAEDTSYTSTSATVDGLDGNTEYNVRVRAGNILGESAWSSAGTGSTRNTVPTIDSFTATPTTINVNAESTLTVTASDLEDDDLYYEFSIMDDPGDDSFGTLTSVEDSHVYTAPDEDGDYVIQVQVFDALVADRDPDVTYPTETVTITVIDVPDKPDAPTVTTGANDTTEDIPRSSVVVTWTAPDDNGSDIIRYEVRYRKLSDSIYTDWPLADDFTDLTTTITGLEPDTTYRVQVRAVNSVSINSGASDLSDDGEGETADDVPDKPDKPTLTVPEDEITQLRVDWTAPADNGSAITDYDIQYRLLVPPGEPENTYQDWEASTVSTDLFTTITGLTETTTYEIRIRAVNSIGNSEWSDPGVGVTGSSNVVPTITSIDASEDVVVVFVHPTLHEMTTITVVATDDNTLPANLTYTFTIVDDSATDDHGSLTDHTDSHRVIYTPPPDRPGVYTIMVEVADDDPDLEQPTASIDITAIKQPDTPNAPTVMTDSSNSFQLLVSWDEPTTNFSPITDYDIQYKESTQDDSDYQEWNAVSTSYTSTSATVDGLDGNTEYDVRVRAANIAGESEWSSAGTGSTRNTVPTIDSFVADPTTIEINEESTVTAIASDVDGDDLYYEFSIMGDPGDGTYGTLTPDSDGLEYVYIYTAPGEAGDFVIQVQVFDALVADRDPDVTYLTETVTIAVTDVPDTPEAPTVTTGTNDNTADIPRSSVVVAWTAPDDNGSAITSYDVQYRKSSDSDYTSLTLADDFTDLTTTITGLDPNTTYHVQVRAVNSVSINSGIGEWSDDGEGETADDVPGKPDAPTLTVPEDEITQLRVDWIAPNHNGATITDYDIQYRLLVPPGEPENTYQDWEASTVSTDLFTTITGLTETTTYEIRIRAVNSIGNSEWSDPGVGTTGSSNAVPTITSIDASEDVVLLQGESHDTLSDSVTITVTATDDLTDPEDLTYTFSASIGTIVSDGEISNMASFSSTELGLATITVEVSDGDINQIQPTDTIDITVIKRPDAPAAPTVMEDPNNSFQLLVDWDEPTTNFSPIVDYDVRYKESSQPASAFQEWNAEDTSYIRISATVDGLDGNTEYDVRVRAANAAGEGDWSPSGTGSTRNTAPTITSFTASPEPVQATQDSTITVVANDIEGDTLTYTFSLPHETMDSDHGSLSLLTGSNVTTYTAPSVASTYTIRVVVSGGGSSVQQDLSIVVTTATPPTMDAPTVNPHDDADTLIIRWTAPDYSGPTLSYNIRYKLSNVDSYTIYADSNGDAIDISRLFLILSGLSTRTRYNVQVRAINSIGTGDWSPDGTGTTRRITARVPDAPLAPIVNTIFGLRTSLEVIWDHPNDNGSDITDYNMQYREVGDASFSNSSVTGAFHYFRNDIPREPLTRLTSNTTYEVRVQARNAIGTGPWSPVGLGTTDNTYDPQVPEGPIDVEVFPHTNSRSLNVTWETPQDVFDQAILDIEIFEFEIQYQTDLDTDWTSRTTRDETSTVLTGLDRDTSYFVRVRGENSGGVGEWSDENSHTTGASFPRTVPDTPGRPTTSNITHNSFTITWSESDDNGSEVLDYEIQYREAGNINTWRFWDIADSGELSWDIEDLVPFTLYQTRVRAYSRAGYSEWSRIDAERTLRDPSPSVSPPDKAVISSVTAQSPSILRVLWTEPDDNQSTIIDYDVEYRTTTPSEGEWIDFPFFGTPSLVENTFGVDVLNLNANTEYEIRLRAVNTAPQDEGNGEWSDSVTATTLESPVALPPQIPVISAITSPAADTLSVSWIAPPVDSDPDTDDAVIDYDVQYKLPTDDSYTDWPVGNSFTSTTTDITGLLHNKEYQVRVQATNSAGPSGYGNPTRGTTVFSVPDPPGNLMVSANPISTKLNVSWDVPNLFGGTITDYDVQYREGVDDGETENAWLNWPATDTINTNPSETIDSLTADTEYDVRVRAESNSTLDDGNGVGIGDWTEAVSGSTASQDTVVRVPDAPVITSPSTDDTTSDSSTDITLSWSNPNNNGAIITGFYVEYKTVPSNAWLALGRVSSQLLSRMATISSLTPGTRYQVRVYARNSVGDSPYSTVRTIRTGITVTPPPAPSVSVTGTMPTSLTVTWIAPQTIHTITSYDVEFKLYSASPLFYSTWTRLMTGLSESITGLLEGTRYNIRVRAVVDDVDGAWGVTDGTTGTTNVAPRIIEFRSRQTQIQTNQTAEILVFATDADN